MSEHISHSGEHNHGHENQHDSVLERDLLKQKLEAGRDAIENSPSVEAARAAVHEHASVSSETSRLEDEGSSPATGDNIRWWSAELRTQALDRTLASVRNRLTNPEKRLSKVIHQPVVEKVSDVAGKTVARPSGILFGGIFSFVGSLSAYLLARHLGGQLHYGIFAVTFVGGFALGLCIELMWRLLHLHLRRVK